MKKKTSFVLCLAALIMAACGEETRNGQLTLSGAAPVRLVDESGKTVEFVAGATKVQFAAGSSGKFTVTVSQGKDKQAKFSGKAPTRDGSWNFTLKGRDIGQPVDLASLRSVDYYGRTWRSLRDGAPCGMGGRWLVEEEYQKCNEDWRVNFADAGSAQTVGSFHSRLEDQDCLLSSREIYCQGERPMPGPPFPRRNFSSAHDSINKLDELSQTGLKFD
ncbi:MAG: hypothetical protein HY077_18885 [Elusimicrobia bacterium]|nr:hypothetical protein [Elusimicrobiota bacterium]